VKTQPTILEAIRDPKLLGSGFKRRWLRKDTWFPWRAFLCAVFCLPFESSEAFELYKRATGRSVAPTKPFQEIYPICGRRSGKSYVTAAIATYCAAFKNYEQFLSHGEVGVVAIVAADRQQSQILLRYIRGFIATSPVLRSMVVSDLKETIRLSNNIEIQVLTADFRSVRGRTVVAALVDELAFLNASDGSANPDSAVLEALRPSLISIPDSILIGLSSPWGKRGELYKQFQTHYGKDESDDVLVFKADSRTMNPSLNEKAIAAAYQRDPISARTEFGSEFRDDLSGFLSQEILDACIVRNRASLPRLARVSYYAFADLSGGRVDSATLGIAHLDNGRGVLDLLVERVAPFSPEQAVEEFCAILKQYGCHSCVGDKYAASWMSDAFQNNGISYQASERSRSQIYLEALPSLISQKVELLDHPRMISQFLGLERKLGRNADIVDHGPGGHDDICNSAAGALVLCLEGAGQYGYTDYILGVMRGIFKNPLDNEPDQQVFKDARGNTVSNPRNDNLDKQKNYELEKRLLGLDRVPELNPVTKKAWERKPTPECKNPDCRKLGKATVEIAGGQIKCNQCGLQFWPDGSNPGYVTCDRNGPIWRRLN
jgi:hypothetical protein